MNSLGRDVKELRTNLTFSIKQNNTLIQSKIFFKSMLEWSLQRNINEMISYRKKNQLKTKGLKKQQKIQSKNKILSVQTRKLRTLKPSDILYMKLFQNTFAIICIAAANPATRVLQSGYNCDPNTQNCPCDPTTQDCSCWNCYFIGTDLMCFYICS
ncbi:hypothetical protein ABPG72_011044 [Tetrahymena utriculariae]